jgi:hypothetical protein
MASGTWEGNPDSTIATPKQFADIDSGLVSNIDVLKSSQVSSAHKNLQ